MFSVFSQEHAFLERFSTPRPPIVKGISNGATFDKFKLSQSSFQYYIIQPLRFSTVIICTDQSSFGPRTLPSVIIFTQKTHCFSEVLYLIDTGIILCNLET